MPNYRKKMKKQQEPELVEGEKNTLFIKGFTANDLIQKVMKDLYSLKKPAGAFLGRKNVIKPFDDPSPIEFLCQKNDSSLFMFSSHSKKRPNNITMGRTFDGQLLDMVEFGVDSYKPISEFKTSKLSLGSKPVLIFTGEPFETEYEMIRIKNLLNDLFCGPVANNIRVGGIEHVILFAANSGKIHMRLYIIEQKKIAGAAKPVVSTTEMGPRIEFSVRRTNLASYDNFKRACKQKEKASKSSAKNKNISTDGLGETRGKIHIGHQDFNKMYNVKY